MTVFLADMHLQPGDQPQQNRLLRQTLRRCARAGRAVLLGDTFNCWYERRGRIVGDYAEVLGVFAEAAAGGLALHHVCGNRDFVVHAGNNGAGGYYRWPDEPRSVLLDHGIEPHGEAHEFTADGTRVLCAHGDRFCTADRGYQRLRAFLHGPLGRLIATWAPFWVGCLIVGHIQRQQVLRHYGVLPFAKRIQDEALLPLIERGVDLVVCGHIHCEERRRLQGPTRGGELVAVPSWADSGGRYGRFVEGRVDFADAGEAPAAAPEAPGKQR